MTQLTHDTGQIIDVPDSAVEFYTAHHWTPYAPPVETPDSTWTIPRIDEWASEQGVDLPGAKTKQDKLDLIAKASDAKEETDATGTQQASAVPATEPAAAE
ncbi:MAG: hypothetical protein ABF966_10535 [Bifidobacterium psychraerophilum]|uniref:hypothetical protein n=1 Tax=Bifidobacterium psychraerophilum TaxID=218140 RepID=UPI0039EB198E